ncbi:MAG TPA: hypothetical protein VFM38_12610 [Candidatus Limnocylindrales bacterium]|nr:hypothetical protein [Candidatus Limnocylindrales bacterium]
MGDLSDVARRLGRYWWLFAILTVGGMVLGFAQGQERTYTATARIVLDTPDPTTRQEAIAIGDTVKAIATSPTQVQSALRRAGVERDPLDVAQHHVSASGLGSSAIVRLSVSDTDRRVAAKIANALALQVIVARERVTRGASEQQLSDLDTQLEQLGSKMSRLDGVIAALNADIAAGTTTAQVQRLRAQLNAAVREHDLDSQRRRDFESERVSILAAFATRPKPSIISTAAEPSHADSSGRLQYVVLGGLLGLILGVAFAAIAETIRPTVVGGDALAAEFGVPLLARFRRLEGNPAQDLSLAAGRIRLASEAAGVGTVELVSWPPDASTGPLREGLERATAALGLEVESGETSPLGGARLVRTGAHAVGVVLLAPRALKRRDTLEIGDLLALRRVTLLGLVVYARSARLRTGIASRRGAVRAGGGKVSPGAH